MKIGRLLVVSILILLFFAGTAVAAWPTSAQGDQYNAVNAAMEVAVAGVGISPETFVSIYDGAIAGDVSGFTDSQLAAACQVLSELSAYTPMLDDYNTAYSNLGCSTRLASSGPSRSAMPSTGIALALLAGSGIIGLGAATRLLKKSR